MKYANGNFYYTLNTCDNRRQCAENFGLTVGVPVHTDDLFVFPWHRRVTQTLREFRAYIYELDARNCRLGRTATHGSSGKKLSTGDEISMVGMIDTFNRGFEVRRHEVWKNELTMTNVFEEVAKRGVFYCTYNGISFKYWNNVHLGRPFRTSHSDALIESTKDLG